MGFKYARYVYWLVALLIIGGVGLFWLTRDAGPTQTQPSAVAKPAEALTKVKIGYLPATQALPVFVGIEKGYFKEAGLDVEALKFDAPNQIIDSLMNGSIDFGSAAGLGIIGIADTKNPGKMRVIDVSTAVDSLVVPKDSTLTSISDLKGKKLGILAGTIQWQTIARELLAKNGLDMNKDVTIVELAPAVQVQALATGQVDALLALEPIPTVAIGNSAGKLWMAHAAERYISDPLYAGADVVRTQFSQEHPDATAKVMAVIEKSIKEIQANPDADRQYLTGYTALTPELINKVPLSAFKSCVDLLDKDRQDIQTFFSIFKKYGVVEKEIDLNGLLYCK